MNRIERLRIPVHGGRIVPYAMPAGYVSDFMFCPPETRPPPGAG